MPLLALSLLVTLQTPAIPVPPFRRVRGLAISDSRDEIEVGKERFYVLSDKRLACYETGAGKLVWERKDIDGEQRSIRLQGSHLFLGGAEMAAMKDAKLLALDASSGRTLWKSAATDPGTQVAVQGSTVYATFGPATLAALDLATGRAKWTKAYPPASQKAKSVPNSTSVLVSGKGIVMRVGNVVYGMDPQTGREKWRIEGLNLKQQGDLVRVRETLALSVDDELRAYDIASGRPNWTASTGSGEALGVIGSRFAVISGAHLNLLDPATGQVVGSIEISDPAVYGSDRYIASFGSAFVAEGTKYLLALDAMGRTRWRLPVGAIGRPIWYGGKRMATYDKGVWRLYEQGSYPPLPVSTAERVRFAQAQVAHWDVLDASEKKRLEGLGDDLFEPLLRTYLTSARLEDSGKVKDSDSIWLYSKAMEQAELLAKVTTRKRTRDLVAMLRKTKPAGPQPGMGIGSGSGWQTLLTLLAEHGDPQIVAPIMVEELRNRRVDPSLMAHLNVALSYVARSSHPQAVRYMVDALRNPNAPAQIREAAYHNLAEVGGETGVRTVLAERRRRALLLSLETRMDLAKVGLEPKRGSITTIVKVAQDGKGRTWGLMKSSPMGSYDDLWVAEREDGRWVRPVFVGLSENGKDWQKTETTPTFEGKTAKQWIEGDWVKGLAENADLRRDSDGDGLTDRMEERLGTDPKRADTDGDGDNDFVDPCPTVARAPSTVEEAILAAVFEARHHFVRSNAPALFLAPEGARPFELAGWSAPIIWATDSRDKFPDHPLAGCYEGGVAFIYFGQMTKDESWPSGYIRFNAAKTEGRLSISTYYGGLSGTIYSVRVRKFGNDWIVVGMSLSAIS